MILSLVAYPLIPTMLEALLGNCHLWTTHKKWVSFFFWSDFDFGSPKKINHHLFTRFDHERLNDFLKSKSILKVPKIGTNNLYLKGQISPSFKLLFIYSYKTNTLIIKITCWLYKALKDNSYVLLKYTQKSTLKIF